MFSLFPELDSDYLYPNFNYQNISLDILPDRLFFNYNLASIKSKFSVFNSDYIKERKCKKLD